MQPDAADTQPQQAAAAYAQQGGGGSGGGGGGGGGGGRLSMQRRATALGLANKLDKVNVVAYHVIMCGA